jgi:predicted  nucleic acid-binding Zn-ribbon protein
MKRSNRNRGGIRSVFLAMLFALACAGVCAAIAAHHKPDFRSSGMLSIPSVEPQQAPSAFPITARAMSPEDWCELIRSHRVADAAVQDPIWRLMNVTAPLGDELRQWLDVRARPHSRFIEVSCARSSPAAAAAAVRSVINATIDEESRHQRMADRALNDRHMELAARIEQIRAMLSPIFKEFGSNDLQPFRQAAAERLMHIESALTSANIAIASAPPSSDNLNPLHDKVEALKKLRDEATQEVVAIGMKNAEIQRLEQQDRDLKSQLSPIDAQLRQLQMDENLGEGLTIINTGDLPSQPESGWQSRHLRHAAAIGGAAGLLLALLVTTFRRKST